MPEVFKRQVEFVEIKAMVREGQVILEWRDTRAGEWKSMYLTPDQADAVSEALTKSAEYGRRWQPGCYRDA